MTTGSFHERFASSVLTQSLVRNGYRVTKNEESGTDHDLIAFDKKGHVFSIDVKWTANDAAAARSVLNVRKTTKTLIRDWPVYAAVVIGGGERILASKDLINKIRIKDPSVRIEPIDESP